MTNLISQAIIPMYGMRTKSFQYSCHHYSSLTVFNEIVLFSLLVNFFSDC